MTKPAIERFSAGDGDAPVAGFLHRPADACGDALVLTHGAGANCQAPLLLSLAEAFAARGVTVLRCDLPFRQLRPHGPPPRGSAERDQLGLRHAVAAIRQLSAGRIFLGGHSYGGRQSSMLAASDAKVADALLLLSYPLHPPKRPDELRTAHFPQLRTPAFFAHGSRDGFATNQELTAAVKLIAARVEMMEVESSGHELVTGKNRDSLPQEIAEHFLQFARNSAN